MKEQQNNMWLKAKYEQSKLVLLPKGENSKFIEPILRILGQEPPAFAERCLHIRARR